MKIQHSFVLNKNKTSQKLRSSISLKENKISHLELIRRQNQTQMRQICQLLDWNEGQYCAHQFEVYDWLLKRRFSGCLTCLLEDMAYSPLMRGFFNNEWSKRNQINFLPFAQEHCRLSQSYVCPNEGLHLEWDYQHEKAFLMDEYLYCHNPYLLINDKGFLNNLNYTLNIIFKK